MGAHGRSKVTIRDKTKDSRSASDDAVIRLRAILTEVDLLLRMTDVDALLCHAVEFMRSGLGVERCGLFLQDADPGQMRGTFGTDGQGQTRDERWIRAPKDNTWPRLALLATPGHTAHWLVDTFPRQPLLDAGIADLWRDWVAATPLVTSGGMLIGIVFNDTALTHAPPDDEQQELLAIFCSLLANALEHVRKQLAFRGNEESLRLAHAELAETAKRARAIIGEAAYLLSVTDCDDLLRHAVEFARRAFGIERCGIYLLNEKTDNLEGTFGTDDRGETTDERQSRMDKNVDLWTRLQERIDTGSPGWVFIQSEYLYYKAGRRSVPGKGWVVATPLSVAGDRLTGVMFNDSAITSTPLNETQQDQLAVFCSLLGNLLERKKAEESLRRTHDALSATARRARAITIEASRLLTITDRDDLLRHAVEFVRTELGADRCGIFLLDEKTDLLEGTFGTDEYGQTTDERPLRIPKSLALWTNLQERISAGTTGWVLQERDYAYYNKGPHTIPGRGWVVATPISVAGNKLTGVMFNDSALTHAPLDETQQDQLALFCSLLGNLLERKKAEKGLEWERTLLRTLIDNLPDSIFVKDTQQRFVTANATSATIMGLTVPAAAVGKTDEDFHPPELAAEYRADDEAVLRTGQALVNKEETVIDPSGRKRILLTTKVPLHDAQGRTTGLVGIGRDITERLAAQQERNRLDIQMQHVQKLESLGVLAGGIAHDFNNLLTAILGNADLALAEMAPSAPGRQCMEEIVNVSRRAADLCKNMLAYSGKGTFVVEPLDLSRLVEEMSHMLGISISKNAALDCHVAANLPPVKADATQLRQVVMNLIINASEALGQAGGTISISTGVEDCDGAYLAGVYLDQNLPAGRYVYLEVADSGCGMDKATLERIFDPFFTTKFAGRGLGLAVVQGIVRGHRGTIMVNSGPGKGTTFKVLLPACEAQAPVQQHPRQDDARPQKAMGTILVVDDEPDVRSIANRMLRQGGFSVRVAADGLEAVALFRQHKSEIAGVLLDLTMPRCDGDETFRQLRDLDPGVRVVLTSGYNEQDVTQRFIGKGLAGFIQKPFELNELLATMRDALKPVQPE